MVGKERNSQILMNVPVTNVPRCIDSNANTLGLQHLQFPDMRVSGGPVERARVVHHGMDELLVQQNSIHFPCLGEVGTLPVPVSLSFSSHRYASTR